MREKIICWFVISISIAIICWLITYSHIKLLHIDKTYQVIGAFIISSIATYPIAIILINICNYVCRNGIKKSLKDFFNNLFYAYFLGIIFGLIIIYILGLL